MTNQPERKEEQKQKEKKEYNSFLEVAAEQLSKGQKVNSYIIKKLFGSPPPNCDSPDLDSLADAHESRVEYAKKVSSFLAEATALSRKYKK